MILTHYNNLKNNLNKIILIFINKQYFNCTVKYTLN